MQIAFYQPDIPQNVGAALRLSAAFEVPIHIIGPCGFPMGDKALKRAAMDYAALVEPKMHNDWDAFLAWRESQNPKSRLILFTTKSDCYLDETEFHPTDILLFGRESVGVPEDVADIADLTTKIPISTKARSFNVVMSAAIGLSEALRQCHLYPTVTSRVRT